MSRDFQPHEPSPHGHMMIDDDSEHDYDCLTT